jgi:hypothetical protein
MEPRSITNHMSKENHMTMTEATFKAGDRVLVDGGKYPGVWTIVKMLPTNVRLEQNGAALRCHPSFMRHAPDATSDPVLTAKLDTTIGMQVPGAVVRYLGAGHGDFHKDGLYIVLADKGERINIMVLGGQGGRYLRVPRRNLAAVDASTVSLTEAVRTV